MPDESAPEATRPIPAQTEGSPDTRPQTNGRFHYKEIANRIKQAFSRSGNSDSVIRSISNGQLNQNETPTQSLPTQEPALEARKTPPQGFREKTQAHKEYHRLMRSVNRDNYKLTGFARDSYDPKQYAQREREAYKTAYGEDALKNREGPLSRKGHIKQEARRQNQPETAEFREIQQTMKDHSDEQLVARTTLGGLGAEVAKKMLEERRRASQRSQRPERNQTAHSDSEIPEDMQGLMEYGNEHFEPLLQKDDEGFKQEYNEEMRMKFRIYLSNIVHMLSEQRLPNVTYIDNVESVIGSTYAKFLQRAIKAEIGQDIELDALLKMSFSQVANSMGVELPADYAQHFKRKKSGEEPEAPPATEGTRQEGPQPRHETPQPHQRPAHEGTTDDLTIPTDKRELILFDKEHFEPLLHIPRSEVKEKFTPDVIDLYRRYLEQKVKTLINNFVSEESHSKYGDTGSGVIGNVAFLQRAIYSKTGIIVDENKLLKTPFSQIADEFNIPLPDNYSQYFNVRPKQEPLIPIDSDEPDTGREAA